MKKENKEWKSEFDEIINEVKGEEIQQQKKEDQDFEKANAKWQRMKKELLKGKKITL